MATFTFLASGNYRNRTWTTKSVPVEQARRIMARIVSTDFTDPADSISVDLEVSMDNQNWEHYVGFTAVGAANRVTRGPGNPQLLVDLPENCYVRARITVSGQVRFGVEGETWQ